MNLPKLKDTEPAEKSGALYLVGTPIGNLSDITARAIETLKQADIVAAEDTRHSQILLNHHNITATRLTSYHANNLDRATPALLRELKKGKNVALISDAGSPGISDPGAVLVREAVNCGITVIPVPGATAPILAITASGFPSARFIFEGFLPRKKGRKTLFESWTGEKRTILFFESPKRIVKTLKEIRENVGDRKICVVRELTKKFEEFLRGNIDDVIDNLEKRTQVKGEITVVIAPENFDRK
ncbi:16S rRNA (cytidine(1402)-2'-O)-methyltransferase [hydrothermal vent metagenome]|uniref:16S rRNA (Cytidine(1402)-2'-O)-methyltransferase n=1 Tax=hydrothermal vent metagenome TaxID=652676 RepID=A0A3B1BMH5_9ZZZZ